MVVHSAAIAALLKERCFPVNIANLLRTASFLEHLRWLLLGWGQKKLLSKSPAVLGLINSKSVI